MTTVTLKIEPNLKEQAQKFAQDIGISLSALMKMLLKNTLKTGKVDIEARPRYHANPESGDLVSKDLDKAVAYFKRLANEDGDMEESISEGFQEVKQARKGGMGNRL